MTDGASLQELEIIASTLAHRRSALVKTLVALKARLCHAMEEAATVASEFEEAQARLDEIDMYFEDVQDELEALRGSNADQALVASMLGEAQELRDERAEELRLLAQLQHAREAGEWVVRRLRALLLLAARHLAQCRRREQLLAIVAALRVGRKLGDLI